jgi:hypothetical protein
MQVTINGEARALAASQSIVELLAELQLGGKRVAVNPAQALNAGAGDAGGAVGSVPIHIIYSDPFSATFT